MNRSTLILSLLALAACAPDAKVEDTGDDHDTDTDTDTDTAPAQTHAVVATTFDGVGALAVVDLETLAVTDEISTISSDAVVVTEGDVVFQLNRSDFDSVRVYTPGSFTAPETEISLASGANPWDAEICGGQLFVAQYGTDSLAVYDLDTGVLSGAVDLSAYDDGDGLPEIAGLVELDGKLYVAMQQLDRNNYWTPTGGSVAQVDCATQAVDQAWQVGPNPTISAWPGSTDTLLVRTGGYGVPDGGLSTLDVAAGTQSDLTVTEESVNADLTHVVIASDGASGIVLSSNFEWPATYGVWCLDTSDWSLSAIETTGTYISGLAIDDRDRSWVSFQAPSWGAEDAVPGAALYDSGTCSAVQDELVEFVLDPGSIAFY